MTLLLVLACATLGLVWWVDQHYRAWKVKRVLAEAECKREGHIIHRINAWDDPRHPVDRCKRCQRQWPVQYPCPHCGEELGTHGYRTS